MKLDPTHPSILISAEKLKDAISYGKYGNTEHSRNMMVSRLMDAFWSSQELAGYLISGKAAPDHAKETAKPKLPSVSAAIMFSPPSPIISAVFSLFTDFTMDRWKKWHNIPLDKAPLIGPFARI